MAKRANWTAKREKFSIGIAKGLSQTEAYRQAGYAWKNMAETTLWKAACELAAIPLVVGRVNELLAKFEAATAISQAVTVDSLVAELDHAYAIAVETKNAAAMTGASVAKAKLLGMYVDKQETVNKSDMLEKPEVGRLLDAAKALDKDAQAAIPPIKSVA